MSYVLLYTLWKHNKWNKILYIDDKGGTYILFLMLNCVYVYVFIYFHNLYINIFKALVIYVYCLLVQESFVMFNSKVIFIHIYIPNIHKIIIKYFSYVFFFFPSLLCFFGVGNLVEYKVLALWLFGIIPETKKKPLKYIYTYSWYNIYLMFMFI